MNIEKVKTYSSSAFTDKNKNPICINDILLSGNKLCIYLKNTDKNNIIVGFVDGKISVINPNNTIRVDCEIENLKKNFDVLSNNAIKFCEYKKKQYYHHVFPLYDFFLRNKNKSKRLLCKRLKEEKERLLIANYSPLSYHAYLLNNEYYTNRYSQEKVLIGKPYIYEKPSKNCYSYSININSFEHSGVETFKIYQQEIIELLINEILTVWE